MNLTGQLGLGLLAVGEEPAIDAGSTAWMLTSCALVLLMVPGLAMFYGGLVRRKNVLSTMMHSFLAMAVLGVQWIVIGYALCFGEDHAGIIGFDWDKFCLNGIAYDALYGDRRIPELVFVMFQGKFAIITPALISGAVAERMKLSSYVIFIILWSTLIYCPLAHWVWGEGGWLLNYGVLDFAGGTVVHVSSGIAALVMAMMIGKRLTAPNETLEPGNLILTLTGAGLLWFGWFGFNAGSAIASDVQAAGSVAGLAFATTQTAAAAGALSWIVVEFMRKGRCTSLGLVSGILAGLVAITPGAGHVEPRWALLIGLVAGAICYFAVHFKEHTGVYDDALDAFGVHGVGGAWGGIATGIFCFTPVAGIIDGQSGQLVKQFVGLAAAAAFAAVGTYLIALLLKRTIGLRVTEAQELAGLDQSIHGEKSYRLIQGQA
ncbi:ammonia channel protein [cyanobacterium TDX16]|nr:ammonia channel protein [cyanobacterium TDX16]